MPSAQPFSVPHTSFAWHMSSDRYLVAYPIRTNRQWLSSSVRCSHWRITRWNPLRDTKNSLPLSRNGKASTLSWESRRPSATVPTSRTWTSQPKCRGAYIRPTGLKGSTGSTREPSTWEPPCHQRSQSSSSWQRWRWRKQRQHIAGEYINSKVGKKRMKKEWKSKERKDELHTFKDTTGVLSYITWVRYKKFLQYIIYKALRDL